MKSFKNVIVMILDLIWSICFFTAAINQFMAGPIGYKIIGIVSVVAAIIGCISAAEEFTDLIERHLK